MGTDCVPFGRGRRLRFAVFPHSRADFFQAIRVVSLYPFSPLWELNEARSHPQFALKALTREPAAVDLPALSERVCTNYLFGRAIVGGSCQRPRCVPELILML